ncbi:MAG: WYL domain-containing protein, partial [Pseudomonadales bacterium]|nr:WYL domain-containing protein [Pseudomonadales bacterium]
ASADIKRYMANHNPDSLFHDPSVKAYVPNPGFQPVLTTGHINEYLDMVSGLVSESMAITLETDINVASVQLPDRAVRPEVVREVIKACRASSSIKILYASMANPSWSERVISPHTLVYTGFRWHVRAYCHKRNDYRDFILSRIDRTPQATGIAAPPLEEDKQWNEVISITLVPNTKLTDGQKTLVEKDYGMPEGRLQLRVRKSLAHYTLQRYQAAITDEEIANSSQYHIQLAEQDRKKLYPYLFGSNS